MFFLRALGKCTTRKALSAGRFLDNCNMGGPRTRFATASDMSGSGKIFYDTMVDSEMVSWLHALQIKLIAAL
ncbi:MAG: hypothetical protein ACI9FG_001743 [Crocinitomicaceae bacterium]|jgi:hypothetical protein